MIISFIVFMFHPSLFQYKQLNKMMTAGNTQSSINNTITVQLTKSSNELINGINVHSLLENMIWRAFLLLLFLLVLFSYFGGRGEWSISLNDCFKHEPVSRFCTQESLSETCKNEIWNAIGVTAHVLHAENTQQSLSHNEKVRQRCQHAQTDTFLLVLNNSGSLMESPEEK